MSAYYGEGDIPMTQPEHEAAAPTPFDLIDRLRVHAEYVTAEGVFQMRNATAGLLKEAASLLTAQAQRIAELEGALTKIDAIRNSIIGFQTVNWSEHIYPLVAALNEAGFQGVGYEAARENAGTLVEQIKAAEAERDEARAGLEKAMGAWDWLTSHIDLELDWAEVEEGEAAWRVHRVSGNRNDREWELVATGETPLEAVTKARVGFNTDAPSEKEGEA